MIRFPLILSCGHTTKDMCRCWSEKKRSFDDADSPVSRALDEFNGKWRDTLESYGAKLPKGNRNHGPCPVCGGKDRFRFDDKAGRGTWYCSRCEPSSGGGLLLLSRFIGKSVMETAKELVGDVHVRTIAPKRVFAVDHDAEREALNEQAKIGAKALMGSSIFAQHPYMTKKGLNGEYSVNGEPIYSKGGIIGIGELMLVPFYKNDELVNVQKITVDGDKRPLFGGDMRGVQHVIDGSTKSIGIVEGFATGVTVNMMTGYKVYVGVNTGGLLPAVEKAKADHPESRIVIFADHDELDPVHNFRPGEHYAEEAAIKHSSTIALPPELGDWDDYRQTHGADKCKQAMRDAIKADLNRGKQKTMTATDGKPNTGKDVEPKIVPTPGSVFEPMAFGSWLTEPKQEKKRTGLNALPDGISLDGVDVDNPPNLAGDIVKYMRSGAHRELSGGAYSAMAIQLMSMAGSGLRGYMNSKLSLITITLGVSASGKDRGQDVAKRILGDCGINVYGDIRSDKDVIRAAAYDDGRCFYIKDEAHSLLGDSLGGKDKNTSKIPATLMEIATSSRFILSKLHADEFESTITAKKTRLEKMILAKEDIRLGYNVDLEQGKIKAIDLEIEKLRRNMGDMDRVLDAIEHGIKSPALNLAALSTPQKLASIIDEDAIESGFLGRALIFDCGVERNEINWDLWGKSGSDNHEDRVLFEKIKAEVSMIVQMSNDARNGAVEAQFNGSKVSVIATTEAAKAIRSIAGHYDKEEYRNHSRLGALYARLPERVMSVSSTLALYNVIDGNVLVEIQHVLYALLVALNSIKHLESNLRVNEAATQTTVEAKLDGIKEAIVKRLTVNKNDKEDGWRYKSKIKEYLKRQKYYQEIAKELLQHDQDAFENSIMSLVGEGRVISDGRKVKLNKD